MTRTENQHVEDTCLRLIILVPYKSFERIQFYNNLLSTQARGIK
ncbi:MAG: hypothetical protein PVH12_06470 [Candidatus Bathyarchaeota archaeon]